MKQKRLVFTIFAVVVVVSIGAYVVHWYTPSALKAPAGIEGTITYGPLCPVEPCSAQPNYNFYIIASKPNGAEAARVMPGQNGSYRLTVAPGTYQITASRQFASAQGSQPPTVTVRPGQYAHLDLSYDTGIR